MCLQNTICEKFKDEKYVNSIKRCFIKVGLIRDENGVLNVFDRVVNGVGKFTPEKILADPDAAVLTGKEFADKLICNEVMELVDVTCRSSDPEAGNSNDGDDDLEIGNLPNEPILLLVLQQVF